MPRLLLLVAALTLSLILPAGGQQSVPVSPAAAETVQKDTPRATPGGTTFTVARGWTMTTSRADGRSRPARTRLARRDRGREARKTRTPRVAAAWAAYKPGFIAAAEDRRCRRRPGTAGRSGRRSSTRPRRTSGPSSPPARGVPGRRGRSSSWTGPSRRSRSAARRWGSSCRAPAQRVFARVVRREEGEPAGREAHRHPEETSWRAG